MLTIPRKDGLTTEQVTGLYEFLANQRYLYLYGPIVGYPERTDTFGPVWVADAIKFLSNQDSTKPIFLTIDSYGGSVDDGLMLYDSIKLSAAPVFTIGKNCHSMAVALLVAGVAGHRYIYPHSKIMLHDASYNMTGARMTGREMEVYTQQLKRATESLLSILVVNGAKKTESEIVADINREGDYFLIGQEIVDYGIADTILTAELIRNEPFRFEKMPVVEKNKARKNVKSVSSNV